MENGRIVRLVRNKGFGFIRHDDTKQEYFFHSSALKGGTMFDLLNEGQNVEFLIQPGSPRGPRAEYVRIKE